MCVGKSLYFSERLDEKIQGAFLKKQGKSPNTPIQSYIGY